MHKISKEFEFDFGHRVWSQNLDPKLAGTTKNKCRHLHGHRGKIIVELGSEKLIDGMVMDFNELNFFKQFIDDVLDHKFLVDINDPLIGVNEQNIKEHEHGYLTELDGDEISQSFVYVPFVPTAEEISKWLFGILEEKLKLIVISVTFYETPKAKAKYTT